MLAWLAAPFRKLDLLVRPELENATRTLRGLEQFGFGSVRISIDDLSNEIG